MKFSTYHLIGTIVDYAEDTFAFQKHCDSHDAMKVYCAAGFEVIFLVKKVPSYILGNYKNRIVRK